MSPAVVIGVAIGYVLLLFGIAFVAERQEALGRSMVRNPLIYSLSLAVYCTAWTFYGSVGRAATQGAGFLPIFLGPVVLAPLWLLFLRKMILVSKAQHITSVADFLSSRYGKSVRIGIAATVLAVLGIVPYISIQLKAIVVGFDIMTGGQLHASASGEGPLHADVSAYVVLALAIFTGLFGARHLDPNERHEGLVAAIAFESLIKLIAFLAVGVFVTYGLFHGFGDIFAQGAESERIVALYSLDHAGTSGGEWFWLMLLSAFAVVLLPRQFHVAVVENTDPGHVSRASWLFPLYLLLINLFVLPIAIGGLLLFDAATEPDTYVLSIPLAHGKAGLALFATIGGFSAATGMVITSVIALSIMISNNLVLPSLLGLRTIDREAISNLTGRLLNIRRISIVVVLLLAYWFFRMVGSGYPLVSIGLMSFTAIAQLAPGALAGMYWKRATKAGAFAGLLAGGIVWGFTLPLPTLVEAGLLPTYLLEKGIGGISWLRPFALFGLEGMDRISHAAFWSLLLNSLTLLFVSLYTRQNPLEAAQADFFVDVHKYEAGSSDFDVMRRRAKVKDVETLLYRFLGEKRAEELLLDFESWHGVDLSREKIARSELINYAEKHLTGAIGAASAKIIIRSISKEDPVRLEEMLTVLEQTKEIMAYSKALERKSAELEYTTQQLQRANERLQELDSLKADFITTVTHELRTPITSIKALSKVLQDNPGLPEQQQSEFLAIITSECERVTRLINQVLDLEKIQSNAQDLELDPMDFRLLVSQVFQNLKPVMEEKGITYALDAEQSPHFIRGNADRITQVVINLISNAIKFCDSANGRIAVSVFQDGENACLTVLDNGRGIRPEHQEMIFEKFTQISDRPSGKPQGSGLGLFITRTIVEQHGGTIQVQSTPGEGALFSVFLPLDTRD